MQQSLSPNYTHAIAIVLIATLTCFSGELSAAEAIEFESPRGGEVYYAGQSQPVRIRTRYKTLLVEISRDGGLSFEPLGTCTKKSSARAIFLWEIAGSSSRAAILRATPTPAVRGYSMLSAPFAIIAADDVPVETKKAAGIYTRANITLDETGQIAGIASSGPINLGTEVSGVLGSNNLADAAVTNPKIAAASVTADKINSAPTSSGFVLVSDGAGSAKWISSGDGTSPPSGLAGGDLSGFYPNPLIADNAVKGAKIANAGVDLATKVTGTLPDANLSANVLLGSGKSGGQTLAGGIAASENLVLSSTQHATKGAIVLAPGGGNVGIGIAAPGQRLSVGGTIESTLGGFRFPDGTTQSTASSGAVPSGYSILGESTTPPANYTYTGVALALQGGEQWAAKAAMPAAAASMGVGVINGRVYLVGGTNGGFINNCQEYDPATNTWRARAPMPTARDWVGAAVVNNRLYVSGGFNGTTMVNAHEMYDPATNAWTILAPIPTARSGHCAAAVNGKIYCIGGDLGGTTELTTNEEYDPATNLWAARAALPTARTAAGVAVFNNRIHFIGGSTANNATIFANHDVYDPGANSWSAAAPLGFPRHNLAVSTINGKIYALGGGTAATAISNNDEYDPGSNTWSGRASMPSARQFINAGAVNGRIYVFGGYNGSYLNTTTEYSNSNATYYVHRRN